MKKILAYFAVYLLLTSCSNNKKSATDDMPPLYPTPLMVALNIEEGYIINPVTGDSIQPIINSFGDTVKTGVSSPIFGITISPDSISKPHLVPSKAPLIVVLP